MKPLIRPRLLLAVILFAAGVTALALGAARQLAGARQPAPLAGYVPAGALLAIESPDFGALLGEWSRSPERAAWTRSDNYAVFSNSRLFNRLADAQRQFAGAAGVLPDLPLLTGVAGKESLFAWYDIGALEFVYITRIPAGQSSASSLLKARSGFTRREAGGRTFFVRTAPASGIDPSRTVAFAQIADAGGDLLLLATREDLLADSLKLIAPAHTGDSLAGQPWFREASAAAAPSPVADARPVFHMTLDLARIVPSPYFRSYWIERNITEMKDFRAAVTDLYREPTGFREERTLLPQTAPDEATGEKPEEKSLAASGSVAPLDSVAPLAALAPVDRGVFRAVATRDATLMAATVEERLGSATSARASRSSSAPNPALDVSGSGSATDFETRIDVASPVLLGGSSHPLEGLLTAAGADGLMTIDSAADAPPGTSAAAWVQTRSAVVIRAQHLWTAALVAEALGGSVGESLTAAKLGFTFRPVTPAAAGGAEIFALTGPKRLFFTVRNGSAADGNLLLLANDLALLQSLTHAAAASGTRREPVDGVEMLAGFNHTAERAPFARLVTALDRTVDARTADAGGGAGGVPVPTPPPFFSGNLRSLSDSFAALQSERISERHVATAGGAGLRQTVVYRWAAP